MEGIKTVMGILAIPEALVVTAFLEKCCGIKAGNRKWCLILGIILCWTGSFFCGESFVAYCIFWLTVMMIYCRVFLKGNVIAHEGIIIGNLLLNLFLIVVSALMTEAIMGSALMAKKNDLLIMVLNIYLKKTMYIGILGILLTVIRKRHRAKLIERWCMYGYLIGNVLLVSIFLMWNKSEIFGNFGQKYAALILIIAQMMVFLLLMVIFQIRKNDRGLMVNELLNERIKQQQINILKMEEDYYNARKLRHDMNRFYNIYLRMLDEGNVEKVKELIREQMGNVIKNPIMFFKGNSMINAVLNEKSEICRQSEIAFKILWTTEIRSKMEMDVAVLLSNLLDNAIEAQERLKENKSVSVNIYEQNGMCNIVMKNSVDKLKFSLDKMLINGFETEKEDAFKHGIGLKSVKDTVNKYDGVIDFDEADGQFVVHVAIPE